MKKILLYKKNSSYKIKTKDHHFSNHLPTLQAPVRTTSLSGLVVTTCSLFSILHFAKARSIQFFERSSYIVSAGHSTKQGRLFRQRKKALQSGPGKRPSLTPRQSKSQSSQARKDDPQTGIKRSFFGITFQIVFSAEVLTINSWSRKQMAAKCESLLVFLVIFKKRIMFVFEWDNIVLITRKQCWSGGTFYRENSQFEIGFWW